MTFGTGMLSNSTRRTHEKSKAGPHPLEPSDDWLCLGTGVLQKARWSIERPVKKKNRTSLGAPVDEVPNILTIFPWYPWQVATKGICNIRIERLRVPVFWSLTVHIGETWEQIDVCSSLQTREPCCDNYWKRHRTQQKATSKDSNRL